MRLIQTNNELFRRRPADDMKPDPPQPQELRSVDVCLAGGAPRPPEMSNGRDRNARASRCWLWPHRKPMRSAAASSTKISRRRCRPAPVQTAVDPRSSTTTATRRRQGRRGLHPLGVLRRLLNNEAATSSLSTMPFPFGRLGYLGRYGYLFIVDRRRTSSSAAVKISAARRSRRRSTNMAIPTRGVGPSDERSAVVGADGRSSRSGPPKTCACSRQRLAPQGAVQNRWLRRAAEAGQRKIDGVLAQQNATNMRRGCGNFLAGRMNHDGLAEPVARRRKRYRPRRALSPPAADALWHWLNAVTLSSC